MTKAYIVLEVEDHELSDGSLEDVLRDTLDEVLDAFAREYGSGEPFNPTNGVPGRMGEQLKWRVLAGVTRGLQGIPK